jgi:diamine N-acetyltransferase
MATVTLREVTKDNVRPICGLTLADGQDRFVAPTAVTLAQAQFEEGSIVRAIYADDDLVGLVALAHEDGEWWLWRLMVDAAHQRRTYGRDALALILDLVRAEGASQLFASYVPGEGDPSGFYLRAGFEETERVEDGERVLRLAL